jgi:hypothetical protein
MGGHYEQQDGYLPPDEREKQYFVRVDYLSLSGGDSYFLDLNLVAFSNEATKFSTRLAAELAVTAIRAHMRDDPSKITVEVV